MSNSFDAAPTLPLPQDALAAEPIRTRLVRNTGRMMNYALAHAGTGLPSLEWPNGAMQVGATQRQLRVRVPALSSRHTFIGFEVYFASSAVAGSGFVQVQCVQTALSDSVSAPAAAAGMVFDSTEGVQVGDRTGDGYIELLVTLNNGGSGVMTVESIRFWHVAPTSPWAAGTIDDGTDDGIVAQGADSLEAEEALGSVRGGDLTAELEALQRRPVMHFMLAGVTASVATNQWKHIPARRHYSFARWSPLARRRLEDWSAWAYCTPDTVDDTEVFLLAHLPDADGRLLGVKFGPVTVAADAAATPVWVKLHATVTIHPPEPLQGMGWHGGLVGVHPGGPAGRSTANIMSLSAWGPV